MDYGLYISASGALNASFRQDVLTGNLANVNTVGFKPGTSITRQREPARAEDGLWHMPSDELLERLGAGVMGMPTTVDFTQGAITPTGNDLDLAIRGEGFFALMADQDDSGDRWRLTRDGRFTLDARHRLVSVSSGEPVIGADGRPITLRPDAKVSVAGDGVLEQDGAPVGQLAFFEVSSPERLRQAGGGAFIASDSQISNRQPASGVIQQAAVEESAVNEIKTLMGIQAASREAQSNLNMIQYHDRLLDQTINRFARVA
jgi:flagellar basal-body rod protein FlgF